MLGFKVETNQSSDDMGTTMEIYPHHPRHPLCTKYFVSWDSWTARKKASSILMGHSFVELGFYASSLGHFVILDFSIIFKYFGSYLHLHFFCSDPIITRLIRY